MIVIVTVILANIGLTENVCRALHCGTKATINYKRPLRLYRSLYTDPTLSTFKSPLQKHDFSSYLVEFIVYIVWFYISSLCYYVTSLFYAPFVYC